MTKRISKSAGFAFSCAFALMVASPVSAQNAAVVNNKPIPKAALDEMIAGAVQQGRPDSPELRKAALDQLIGQELLVQQAEKSGLARRADVAKQLAMARSQILTQAALADHMKANGPKDAEVKAEYDRLVKEQSGGKEYKARHILVEKEDVAKKLIEDLKKGAKFEDLAKAQSKDSGSGANGGDLGWNGAAGYVKPFSDAMTKLAKGGMTDAPVQTQFGWHVIRVDDVRDAKAPAFDEVKQNIQQFLTQKKIQDYVAKLRAAADVK